MLAVTALLDCAMCSLGAAEGRMIRTLFLVISNLAVLVSLDRLRAEQRARSPKPSPRTSTISSVRRAIPRWSPVLGRMWIGQYMDRYGKSTYVPLWVPPHWGCWYWGLRCCSIRSVWPTRLPSCYCSCSRSSCWAFSSASHTCGGEPGGIGSSRRRKTRSQRTPAPMNPGWAAHADVTRRLKAAAPANHTRRTRDV